MSVVARFIPAILQSEVMCYTNFAAEAEQHFKNLETKYKPLLISVASSGSTVVEHLPHHLNVRGLSLTTTVGNGRDKMVKIIIESNVVNSQQTCLSLCFLLLSLHVVARFKPAIRGHVLHQVCHQG
jgi:hypothetical protein